MRGIGSFPKAITPIVVPSKTLEHVKGDGMGCVYQAENLTNGKLYIGKTIQKLKQRIKGHIQDVKRKLTPFSNAIRKYGTSSFQWTILYQDSDEKKLLAMEINLIKHLDTIAPNGYNIALGGNGSIGYRHTSEAIKKIRNAVLGRKHTKKTIEKMCRAQAGKVVSAKVRAKISKALTGRQFSEEHKANIGKGHVGIRPSKKTRTKLHNAQLGNTKGRGNKGRIFTKKTKAKMSVSAKGKVLTDETRSQISASLMGHVTSEETKRKISEANRGKKRSKESVKRIWELRRKNGTDKWAKEPIGKKPEVKQLSLAA